MPIYVYPWTNEVAVDLGSWQLVDDPAGTTHTLTFAAGTIVPAGGFAVIVRNADPAVNGGVTGGIAFSSMSLGNSSNELLLRDDGGLEVDRVSWDSGWSGTAGTSWELLNPGSDNADPVNWASATTQWAPPSSDLGTPGAANSALATVPEPSALALTLPLLVATGAWRRRRQR